VRTFLQPHFDHTQPGWKYTWCCKFASAPKHSKTIDHLGFFGTCKECIALFVFIFAWYQTLCVSIIFAIWLWLVFFLSLTIVFCSSRIKLCYLVMLQSSDYEVVPITLNCLHRYRLDPRVVNNFINLVWHFFKFAINCMIWQHNSWKYLMHMHCTTAPPSVPKRVTFLTFRNRVWPFVLFKNFM